MEGSAEENLGQMITGLASAEPGSAAAAARAVLAETGPAAVPALAEAMQKGEAPLSWRAAAVLGDIGGPSAIEALGRALHHRHPFVALAAVEALANVGPAGIQALCRGLGHGAEAVRLAVVGMLVGVADPAAIPFLCEAVSDPNQSVSVTAAGALQALAPMHRTRSMAAIKPLQERLRKATRGSEASRVYQSALTAVHAAASGLGPGALIPADAPALSTEALPMPSPGAVHDLDSLPVAPEELAPVAPERAGIWARVRRWMRTIK